MKKNHVMQYGKQVGEKRVCYIDSIDFECEISSIAGHTYPDPTYLEPSSCARNQCGVYRVVVEAVEYISPEEIRKMEMKFNDIPNS